MFHVPAHKNAEHPAAQVSVPAEQPAEWSGHPDPDDPDNWWIDDKTGERIPAE